MYGFFASCLCVKMLVSSIAIPNVSAAVTSTVAMKTRFLRLATVGFASDFGVSVGLSVESMFLPLSACAGRAMPDLAMTCNAFDRASAGLVVVNDLLNHLLMAANAIALKRVATPLRD